MVKSIYDRKIRSNCVNASKMHISFAQGKAKHIEERKKTTRVNNLECTYFMKQRYTQNGKN